MSKKVTELPEHLTALDPNDLMLCTIGGTTSKSIKASNLFSSNSVEIVGNNIDWAIGSMFWEDVSANTTYTFTNATQTKTIKVAVTNTSGGVISVTFPSPIYKEAGSLDIPAGQAAIYTLTRINSNVYLSSVTNLVLS